MAAEVEVENVAINSAKAKTSVAILGHTENGRLLVALNSILLLIMFNLCTALQSASDSDWVSLNPESLCAERSVPTEGMGCVSLKGG